MSTEVVTLLDIQNRTDADYNLLRTGYPLSGYEDATGPPEATVESFDAAGVTLDVTTFFEGRLCQPEFRILKDVKTLANIVANLGSPISPGPKKFILISSTDEEADYLENKLIDGDGILVSKLTESSGFESLQLDVRVKNSIEIELDILHLVGDENTPGIDKYYGTSAAGTKGWHSFTTQDKRVSISSVDSASDFLENKIIDNDGIQITNTTDSTGFQTLDFSVNIKNSIEIDSDYLQLINDENIPGNSKFYGTTTVGVKGWQSLPTKNSIEEDSAELQLVNDSNAPGNSKFYGTTTVGVKGWQSFPIKRSIEENSAELQLINDETAPGNLYYYGTNAIGIKGWQAFNEIIGNVSITVGDIGSGVLDDKVVGGDGILTTVVTESNGEQLLDFSVLTKNSIEIDSDYLQLVSDENAPGNSKFYGTSIAGVKGWQSLPVRFSVAEASEYIQLLNDNLAPGSQKYYGTDNAGTKGFHALPLPGVGGDLYPEDSINVVSSIPDSAGITDFTISLVNDENVPGYYKYYGTNSVGTRGWRDLSDLPNEIGLGGSPDLDSVGTDYPVLRRCNVNILDGSISDVGILGDDIVLSGDGITADQQLVASKVWNAVWNDIVDFQELDDKLRFGKCYYDSNTGAKICNKRCQKSVIGIASDTFGYALGAGNGKAPIGVTGWVLAFVDKEYERGTPLTNDKVGNLTEMTLAEKQMYPERIVAIYKKKEAATTWGLEDKKVQVNGRHWVKIK